MLPKARERDEVTYFNVWDLVLMYLDTKYAKFQEKIFTEIDGKTT